MRQRSATRALRWVLVFVAAMWVLAADAPLRCCFNQGQARPAFTHTPTPQRPPNRLPESSACWRRLC